MTVPAIHDVLAHDQLNISCTLAVVIGKVYATLDMPQLPLRPITTHQKFTFLCQTSRLGYGLCSVPLCGEKNTQGKKY